MLAGDGAFLGQNFQEWNVYPLNGNSEFLHPFHMGTQEKLGPF